MILIVDDDYSVTASLGLLLKQKGFTSVAAATPESAWRSGSPRHPLQDMNFPRDTKPRVEVRRIRRRPGLPVILSPRGAPIQLAVEGMKAGGRLSQTVEQRAGPSGVRTPRAAATQARIRPRTAALDAPTTDG
jgi:CheY-like chemotaxis protein